MSLAQLQPLLVSTYPYMFEKKRIESLEVCPMFHDGFQCFKIESEIYKRIGYIVNSQVDKSQYIILTHINNVYLYSLKTIVDTIHTMSNPSVVVFQFFKIVSNFSRFVSNFSRLFPIFQDCANSILLRVLLEAPQIG